MSSWIKWLLVGLAAYLVLLVATFPASHLLGRVALPADVKISGVSGTIWSGNAQRVVIAGSPVNNLNWELSFIPLIWGSIHLDLDGGNSRDRSEISFSGPVQLSMLNPQQIGAQNLTAFLPVDLLMNYLPLPIPVEAEGRIRVDIEELDFNQQCQILAGKGQWLNAQVPGTQGLIDLGNFAATFGCQDGAILLTVSEPNMFGLSAVARIPPDFNFTVDGQFKPDPSLPRDVHTAARFFGQPNAQGYYTIEF